MVACHEHLSHLIAAIGFEGLSFDWSIENDASSWLLASITPSQTLDFTCNHHRPGPLKRQDRTEQILGAKTKTTSSHNGRPHSPLALPHGPTHNTPNPSAPAPPPSRTHHRRHPPQSPPPPPFPRHRPPRNSPITHPAPPIAPLGRPIERRPKEKTLLFTVAHASIGVA